MDATPFACGKCLPCRINRRRVWTHRILLEAKAHLKSCFVTLTYSDDFLPVNPLGDPIVIKRHLQNYIKRLRRKFPNGSIRYYGVGEYGDLFDRPHYHVVLYGLGESDIEALTEAWHHRGESIGKIDTLPLLPETAQYIAGYTIKKLTKENDHRLYGRTPEFCLSSKQNGGIGIEEVRRIARKLSANPYFDYADLLKSFDLGAKSYPLGNYLEEIFREEYQLEQFQYTGYKDLDERRKGRLLEFQKRLLLKYGGTKDSYYLNIMEDSEQQIKEMETRFERIQNHKLSEKKRKHNAKTKQF